MIATHNIKVNGRWYAAGEVVPDQQQVIAKAVETPKAEKPVEETPVKEEQKPKSTAQRRRTNK